MPRKNHPASLPDDLTHGGLKRPGVTINGYSLELHDGDGFVGDSVSRVAYSEMLDVWRKLYRRISGVDPLGSKPTRRSARSGWTNCCGVTARQRRLFQRRLKTTPGSWRAWCAAFWRIPRGKACGASWWAAAFSKAWWASWP
jgi:hypothetical protein